MEKIISSYLDHAIRRYWNCNGAGLYLPLAIATAGDLAEPDAKGRALSFAWGANAAGAVIGIPIGLWLAEKTSWRMSVAMILLFSVIALVGMIMRSLKLRVAAPPSLREQAMLLLDRGVMSVIGVTLLTATAGLGLYVFTAPALDGSATSSDYALSLWNIGGLFGSLSIGYVVDRVGKPQWVMVTTLATLVVIFASIPITRTIPHLGLLPFLIWGAMGWSTMTPQQYRLSQLKPGHDAALVALNSSAVSLGAVTGAALGGLIISGGFDAKNLPYLSTGLVFFALVLQVTMSLRSFRFVLLIKKNAFR